MARHIPKPDSLEGDEERVIDWIRGAKEYVVPTDDLRPRLLEAARDWSDTKAGERRIGYAIIGIAVIAWCSSLGWPWLASIQARQTPRTYEAIEQRTLEIHDTTNHGIHDATLQAYEEWRAESQRRLPITHQIRGNN
ncbi:hypothetical protein VN12_09845 [Pirellula sp. SH-Sr6A]|uniref:hypothetical protein n=1 Tax=Pirellula sp. SH-Sr6A TaxID=1632865 RepID=UPI00078E08AB|nr:hypothetical protein [Pirellula sp. SH-Sr6A]AMV32416.1 hypothetical protein VN12_09845 [Pirellula sp. SH-Sr6A]